MEKWNSIKRKKYGYLYVVLKAVCFGMLNILCYRMLNILGFLQVFQKDFIPYITTTEGIASVGLILICIAIYSRKGISYLGLNLIIKHYKYVICILAFVIGIFVWQRCDERLIAGVLFCEEVFLVGFIEIESNRIFPYEFRDEYQGEVFYTEKPVFERSMLTKAQENALIQILKILDNRSSFDSMNIALIGAWGKGKTSVMNALISELQIRGTVDPEYFVLKINTQTIQGISNILDYVRGYIYLLFKQYGIVSFQGKTSVAFLTAMMDMLGHLETKSIMNAFESQRVLEFSDLECEKQVFSNNIQKLLERSQKKNIVFIIDDAERSEHNKQILKLLSEFTSVNGILSVISLDDRYDKRIQPTSQKISIPNGNFGNQNNAPSEALDKYIHVRVRIEELNHIEYENSIRNQLIDASQRIRKSEKGLYYISCIDKMNSNSLFDIVEDHGTNRIEAAGSTVIYGEHNMLMELFHYNLKNLKENQSLGNCLEQIIKNYFCHCREFKCVITDTADVDSMGLFLVMNSWFEMLHNDTSDWSHQIEGTVAQYFWQTGIMIESLDILKHGNKEFRSRIQSFDSYYELCIKQRLGISLDINNSAEYVEINSCNDSTFWGIKKLLFSETELKEIENILVGENYSELQQILTNKLRLLMNLWGLTQVLSDFMEYFRDTLNNYRLFKMQLREAELLDMYYLEYLTKDWMTRESVRNDMEQLLKKLPWCEGITPQWPSLSAFLNTVLYEEYITAHGTRFTDGTFQDCRAWILYAQNREILVVTAKKNGNIVHCEYTTEGKPIEIVEEEKNKIETIINQYIREEV